MSRMLPHLGRGMAFPFRLNRKGGVATTSGSLDSLSVGTEYIYERFTLADPYPLLANHVSEAIGHILLTKVGERDWLPTFGSNIDTIIFDPNLVYTQQEFETWMQMSTLRWEKRAYIQVPEGILWKEHNYATSDNTLPALITPTVVTGQVPENLVAPFVTPRQARVAEYPLGNGDKLGHDWLSRYRNFSSYSSGGASAVPFRVAKKVSFGVDDIFYEVKPLDTWLTVSYKLYTDVRLDWLIKDCYVQDIASEGQSRDLLDTTGDPIPGTYLRVPSKTRALMELVR